MNLFEYYLIVIIGMISSFIHLKCYELISENIKIKYNLKLIISLLFCGIILMINTYFNVIASRLIVSVSVLIFLDKILFKEKTSTTIMKCTISYLTLVLSEIVLLAIMVLLEINLEYIDSSVILKFIMSFSTSLLSYLMCTYAIIKTVTTRLIKLVQKDKLIIFMSILSAIFFTVTIYFFLNNISSLQYLGLFIASIIFMVLCIMTAVNSYRMQREVEKTEAVLKMITKYEKIIEESRVNRHEMLNNILVIKTYENKNSDECNRYIEHLVNTYGCNNKTVKNIHELPPGLKGIIYYKLKDADEYNLNVTIKISKNISKFIEKLNNRVYVALCKVFAIIVDNAIEASIDSEEKIIIVEVYENSSHVIIEVYNTFSNKVDVKKLDKIGYSTKGKQRGLGLFIANNIISRNNSISLTREVQNDLFVSIIKIEK